MSNDLTISELQRQIASLNTTVSELNRTIVELRILVAELATKVKLSSCPNPGACIDLGVDVDELSKDVVALKSMADERRGERGVIALFCTILGSGIGALVSWWFSRHA